jgi:hypothetical protein
MSDWMPAEGRRGRWPDHHRLRPELLLLEDRRLLATFDVTSTADSGSTTGTLRWAVAQANAATSPSSIEIELGTTAATITLTQGQLELTNTADPVAIYDGPKEGPVTISGNNATRVFQLDPNVTATISGLTIANGSATGHAGGIYNHEGFLTLDDCTLTGNYSQGYGGAVFSGGGQLDVSNCTIASNSCVESGGGLQCQSPTIVTSSTFTGNYAGFDGGAIDNFYNRFSVQVGDSILTGDSCASVGPEFQNGVISLGHNLISETDSSFGWVNSDLVGTSGQPLAAMLASLGNYGGQTDTLALLPGSPAIGAGIATDYAGTTTPLLTDQRGYPLDSPNPDIGAFQSGGFTLTPAPGSTPQSTLVNTEFANPLALTVTANDPFEPVAGGVITFTAPSSGASASLSATTITLGANGLASVTATANAVNGSYTVNASVGGASTLPFALQNVIVPTFSDITNQTITYGTPSVALGGTLSNGSQYPDGTNEFVAVTLDGVTQDAPIGTDGAFSTTFETPTLSVSGSPYTVTYSYAGDALFMAATTTSTLTVVPAQPVIVWTDPADITYGTPLSSTQLDAATSVAGTFTYTPAAGTILPAGANQTLTVAFTPTDSVDYTGASASVTINVDGGSVAITWPNPADITYGTPLSATQLDATASEPGTFTYTPAAGTVLQAGADQTLSVIFTPTDSTDYSRELATATINVGKATPTITWTNPAGITFGTPLNDTQLDATPSVPGTLTYAQPAGTILSGGSQTLSVTLAPTDSTDYNSASGSVTINVAKATPTIVWANPAGIPYGTPLSDTQLDALATWTVAGSPVDVDGAYTYTPAVGTVLPAGNNQTLSVTFAPSFSNDYNSVTATATIDVGTISPTVTWSSPGDITYGTPLSATQLDATASIPGTFTYSPALGTVLHAGTNQTLSVTFTPDDSTDYSTITNTATITVDKATPTVTWTNPADITYGTPLSATQLDATASVPGTFTYTPASGTVFQAGTGQALSVAFIPTDSTDYHSTTATLTIDVNRVTPSLTIAAPGGTYDGTPFPASVSVSGLSNTPAVSLEGVTPTLTYYLGATTSGSSLGSVPPTAPGTYTVVASFPGSANYGADHSTPAVFTINPAAAIIALTSSTSSAVYDQPVTWVAAVTAIGTPGGSVTFFNGTTALATVPLDNSGQATLTTTGLDLGSNAITAIYSGDTDVLAAHSGSVATSVGQAATAIILAPHPVLKKKRLKAVGLTAEIQPVAPGGGVPTGGVVTFELIKKHHKKIRIKTLGTAAVNAGAGTLTLKPNKVANQVITIIYSGDADYIGSTVNPPKLTRKALKILARSTL